MSNQNYQKITCFQILLLIIFFPIPCYLFIGNISINLINCLDWLNRLFHDYTFPNAAWKNNNYITDEEQKFWLAVLWPLYGSSYMIGLFTIFVFMLALAEIKFLSKIILLSWQFLFYLISLSWFLLSYILVETNKLFNNYSSFIPIHPGEFTSSIRLILFDLVLATIYYAFCWFVSQHPDVIKKIFAVSESMINLIRSFI